ncbi:MAG: patatin-like phospholipase family protein [Phycisphaeraceae bacterium]|nr:patatin-like phospholipase family protein [Phycisphaeraceae bacterium]
MRPCRILLVSGLVASHASAQAWTPPRFDASKFVSPESRPNQDPDVAFVVAVSGGGHRSANFGAGVLAGLEQIRINVDGQPQSALWQVDAFSTVSGGGFVAAAYLSSLDDFLQTGGALDDFSFAAAIDADSQSRPAGCDPDLREHLRHNYERDLLRGALSPRVIGTLDRGDYLESSFHAHILCGDHRERLGRPSLRLGDIFVPASEGAMARLPWWIGNATAFSNGAQVPMTPDVLATYGVVGYKHDRKAMQRDPSVPREQFIAGIPMSVILKASASFPGVVPPSTFVCDTDPAAPYLHLVDGGLSDNLGVITAFQLLAQDPAPRKVLLVIDVYAGGLSPYSDQEKAPNAAAAGIRSLTIGLDSWRTRYEEIARSQGLDQGQSLTIIRVDFDDMRANDPELWRLIDEGGTRLTAEPEEQDRLINAGMQVLLSRRAQIEAALSSNPR